LIGLASKHSHRRFWRTRYWRTGALDRAFTRASARQLPVGANVAIRGSRTAGPAHSPFKTALSIKMRRFKLARKGFLGSREGTWSLCKGRPALLLRNRYRE